MNYNGQEWATLIQMTIIATSVGKKPLEEMELTSCQLVDIYVNKNLKCTILCLVAQSCLTLCDPTDCILPGSSVFRAFPCKNTGADCHFLLQWISPTQGSKTGLPHCRCILYWLSHQRNPRILEWVDYPFSGESSWPRNWIRVSCIAGGFFITWATTEAWYAPLGCKLKK